MSSKANVRSLDAVRRFRPAVIRFHDDLGAALTALRTQLGRTLQTIDHEWPAYWQQQIRLGFDRLAEARTQLARREMMTVGGHRPECIDEKRALARAKERLELAQQKLRACREWSVKVHRVADEYQSRLGRVEQTLNQSVPRLVALMERIIMLLESYAGSESAMTADLEVEIGVDEADVDEPAAEAPAAGGAAAPSPADAAKPDAADAAPNGQSAATGVSP